jgi:SNF2 family DNA or RNA helicase
LRWETDKHAGFDGVQRLFPEGFKESIKRSRGGCMTELSGKLFVLDKMLASIRSSSSDRIVLISSYTQTLDLFSALCRERGYPCLRLDGTSSILLFNYFSYLTIRLSLQFILFYLSRHHVDEEAAETCRPAK